MKLSSSERWLLKQAFTLGVIAVSAIAILVSIGFAIAHEGTEPVSTDAQYSADSRECHVWGARAAWGAYSRLLGAPGTFTKIPMEALKPIFEGAIDNPSIKLSTIYIAEDAPSGYEPAAYFGWKAAADFPAEDPNIFGLHAAFHGACMKAKGYDKVGAN